MAEKKRNLCIVHQQVVVEDTNRRKQIIQEIQRILTKSQERDEVGDHSVRKKIHRK